MNYSSKREQIKVYFGKNCRRFQYDKGWKTFVATIIISLVLILVIGNGMFSEEGDTRKGVFTLICACVWVGIFNSIQNICRERETIKHEYREGMNLSAYISAHMLFDVLMCAAETIIISLFLFVRFRGNYEGVLFVIKAVFFIFIAIYCSDTLGILVSSFVKSAQEAMSVMPFLLIFQLVFAGEIFELKGICEAISYLTISKWGRDGLLTMCGYGIKRNIFGGEISRSTSYLVATIIIILFTVLYGKVASIVLKSVEKDER